MYQWSSIQLDEHQMVSQNGKGLSLDDDMGCSILYSAK